MKKFECDRVKDFREIGNTIEKYQSNGWSLNTYQAVAVGTRMLSEVEHYLLFEKEE